MTVYTAVGPADVSWVTSIGAVLPCETVTLRTNVSFTYQSYTLTLRKPDRISIQNDLGVITHRSRSNKLYIYRRGSRTRELPLRFNGIFRRQFIEIEEFIDRVRGKLIYYTDEWGDKWYGAITGYEPTFEKVGHDYNIEIKFSVQ